MASNHQYNERSIYQLEKQNHNYDENQNVFKKPAIRYPKPLKQRTNNQNHKTVHFTKPKVPIHHKKFETPRTAFQDRIAFFNNRMSKASYQSGNFSSAETNSLFSGSEFECMDFFEEIELTQPNHPDIKEQVLEQRSITPPATKRNEQIQKTSTQIIPEPKSSGYDSLQQTLLVKTIQVPMSNQQEPRENELTQKSMKKFTPNPESSSSSVSYETFEKTLLEKNLQVTDSKNVLQESIKKLTPELESSASYSHHTLQNTLLERKLQIADPENVLGREVFLYLRSRQIQHQAKHYMPDHRDINVAMRLYLTNWICEVSFYNENWHHLDVFPLTITLLDRLLSKLHLKTKCLQVVVGTIFMIASKMYDTVAPSIPDIRALTSNAVECLEIKRWEIAILKSLDFDVYTPVGSDFYAYFMKLSHCEPDHGKGSYRGETHKKQVNRSFSGIILQFFNEVSLHSYVISVGFLTSERSLAMVLLLRLLISTFRKFHRNIYKKIRLFEPGLCKDVLEFGVLNEKLKDVAKEMDFSREYIILAMLKIHDIWKSMMEQSDFDGIHKKFLKDKNDRVNMQDKKETVNQVVTKGFTVLKTEDIHEIREEF